MRSKSRANLWEAYAQQLSAAAIKLSDQIADGLLGGNHPPGSVPISKSEQLRRFMLLSTPRAHLNPQQQQEADDLWQANFAGRPELEIKKWALEMAREYNRLLTPKDDWNTVMAPPSPLEDLASPEPPEPEPDNTNTEAPDASPDTTQSNS